ncbi:unnamed protein product [Bursaphelenchus okinawaensis]|uniref:Uncharacterized protein n=1 Tax=Bursaphelenchus okinawaensis TaxID=465554 RepID=A0A811LKV0_9BILA|nr:unnamed protein product [Bursaphelenchus okinawaensis]CAG9127636.1 unnamed protein product [Bursaphelenchus okinawaensis]
MNSQHIKPTTYKKNALKQDQLGCIFENNEYYKIKQGTTFKSYDELVHAIIRYEIAARVHLLRSSSNFLKANKKVVFSEDICQQFVLVDRLVFKCPNHEVIKRYDSQGNALYNKRVIKKNIEDPRKCEFTFTVQYNPEINRLQISAGKLYHTGGCNPSHRDLFDYVPKDENNKKKRAIHKKIEEMAPTRPPVKYWPATTTIAFKSKNRTMQSPNLNAPFHQDTDAGTITYAPEVEALISQYVTDCIKKPAGEEPKAGPSNSRGPKRRMADESEVAAKRANDGYALRPNMNYETAKFSQASYVGQDNYMSHDGTVQFEGYVQPVQQRCEGQTDLFSQNQAYCQPAGPSQSYWNQPVPNYEPYYEQTATQQYNQEGFHNIYGQQASNNGFFEPNWDGYSRLSYEASQPPAYCSQDIAEPVPESRAEQPAYNPPYAATFVNDHNVRRSQRSGSPEEDNYDWGNLDDYFEPPLQCSAQEEETTLSLAQNPEGQDSPPIEQPEPEPQQEPAPIFYYDEEEMQAVGSGGADLILMAMEGLLT